MVFQVSAETFGFADGNAGHVCTFAGGAPAVDDFDVLCVNSDTTVSTPSGFTAAVSAVANQGAYVFRRKAAGGEAATVTVTTSGNFNAHVIWVRVTGASAPDVTGSAQANAAAAALSPSFTSSALAESGELALVFAALHTFPGAVPTSPVWSSGYTALAAGFQGTGSSGAGGFVAYKTPAGTAAESPSLTWTNNAADRYVLFLSLTADPGVDGSLGATLPSLAASATAVQRLAGGLAATLPALGVSLAQTPNTKASATASVAAGRTSTSTVSARRTSEHGVT
jgi:hypothetical protein